MDNERVGRFISDSRKNAGMTQKDLAARVGVTDKAVSKWERGLSCPDILLLSPLAEVFGVTAGELLSGEKSGAGTAAVGTNIDDVLQYAEKAEKSRVKSIQGICAAVFSFLLIVGLVVCAICDLAISGAFTWSLYPISSIVFAWLVLFPLIRFGEKGVCGALIALSAAIIPYLYILQTLVKSSDLILPIGIRMAVLSAAFLWIVFALFKILRARKRVASAISLLLMIPFCILVNFSLSGMIAEPLVDVWDVAVFFFVGAGAAALFAAEYSARRKRA